MASEKDWIIVDCDNDIHAHGLDSKANAYETAARTVRPDHTHYLGKLRIYELVAVVTPAAQPANIEVVS